MAVAQAHDDTDVDGADVDVLERTLGCRRGATDQFLDVIASVHASPPIIDLKQSSNVSESTHKYKEWTHKYKEYGIRCKQRLTNGTT